MANLKDDLDQYLLLQNDQKKSFTLEIPSASDNYKRLTNLFSRESEPSDSWLQKKKKECCPTLTRFQRIMACGFCSFMGVLCFVMSLMYIPMLLLKARKFALLFTLGSLFFLLSSMFLWGPLAYVSQMLSKERILLTITYGGTLVATLYCALHLQSTPLTVIFAVGQIVTLVWSVMSSIPGGVTRVTFFSKIFSRSVSNTLNI